jgi:cytochrome c556
MEGPAPADTLLPATAAHHRLTSLQGISPGKIIPQTQSRGCGIVRGRDPFPVAAPRRHIHPLAENDERMVARSKRVDDAPEGSIRPRAWTR